VQRSERSTSRHHRSSPYAGTPGYAPPRRRSAMATVGKATDAYPVQNDISGKCTRRNGGRRPWNRAA
jgi:hypothetical protein